MSHFAAADANVFEAHGAEARCVEEIFCVDDDCVLDEVLDAIEIQGAEFWPACSNY